MRAAAAGSGARVAGSSMAAGSSVGSTFRAVAEITAAQAAVNQLGRAARAAANPVSALTGKLTDALTKLPQLVEAAAAPIEKLVRVHNPAIADAFGRAMSDAYGVVGRQLLPVMGAFVGVARKVGDLLASFEPTVRPAITAVGQLINVIGQEVTATVKKNAPVLELMAAVVTRVAQAASVAARMLGEVVRAFGAIGRTVAGLLGFKGDTVKEGASSVGAAARHARFQAPKDISDDAIKNALQIGKESQAKTLTHVHDKIEEFYEWAKRRFGQAQAAARGAGGQLNKVVQGEMAAGTGDSTSTAARVARFGAARWLSHQFK